MLFCVQERAPPKAEAKPDTQAGVPPSVHEQTTLTVNWKRRHKKATHLFGGFEEAQDVRAKPTVGSLCECVKSASKVRQGCVTVASRSRPRAGFCARLLFERVRDDFVEQLRFSVEGRLATQREQMR
eukprot:6181269-Pleurochrysis_carterae.AAC.1